MPQTERLPVETKVLAALAARVMQNENWALEVR